MTDTPRCRVLLADDHNLVRAGVRRILEGQPDLEVVAEVSSGEAALAALESTPVDVLVLDLSMPGLDGLQVLKRARVSYPLLKILVLTMHQSVEYVERAVRGGADGYLLKDSAVQDLTAALEAVMAGRAYYSPAVQRHLSGMLAGADAPRQGLALLTEREREVLKRVAEGLSTKEIAARLGIGPRTVETHRANVMRKLDLRSVALLTQFAIREGLVQAP